MHKRDMLACISGPASKLYTTCFNLKENLWPLLFKMTQKVYALVNIGLNEDPIATTSICRVHCHK